MGERRKGATKKSPAAQQGVHASTAPPVPQGDMLHEERGVEGRAMPKDEPPRGFDPAKWALMNRTQRRAAKRG